MNTVNVPSRRGNALILFLPLLALSLELGSSLEAALWLIPTPSPILHQ
jgi:hypothetical protein